jgi:flagellar basal body-associated protein FliL
MTKWILALGILVVATLTLLALLSIMNYVVAGLLVTATVGIVGWFINYFSKPREKATLPEEQSKKPEPEQPKKEPKVVLEETCQVNNGEYAFYALDLSANESVRGEIVSNKTVDIYFLTKYGFERFENGEEFSYECGGENILKKRVSFKPSRSATWYLVVDNEGRDKATVDVKLFV